MGGTGTIFEIREFCLHDGPGIRTTVFFKGCPLRCLWCHNPEGLSFEPQLLRSPAGCRHCGQCRKVCPSPERCTHCGACAAACPEQCLELCGERLSVPETAARIRRGGAILHHSGGGVTFSGGEPLAQGDFLLELATELADFHRAIETCGFAAPELYAKMLDQIDLVIQDLKCPDPKRHRHLTGRDLEPILINLQQLQHSRKRYWVRIPLIPGINDSEADLAAFAGLLRNAPNPPEEVQLLPYHHAAGAKYAKAGLVYPLTLDPGRQSNTDPKPFLRCGLPCRVLGDTHWSADRISKR